MNSAEMIKRMRQRAAARAASAAAANKPENAQNAPVNQISGWRRVVDAHAEKTAERAVFERCAKCHFAKQPDGWCYWQDAGEETEWLHHWIETSTCRAAPVRPGNEYMTLAQRDARDAALARRHSREKQQQTPAPISQPDVNLPHTYRRADVVVFCKTKESFGGLSNMASGFPLLVNGVRIPTSEALYQACRFPHLPDVQREIIGQRSPMIAKMKSKPHRKESRRDWDCVRNNVMRWCLRVKLAQNYEEFGRLLLATGDRQIVEQSFKDDYWGAKVAGIAGDILTGQNILGRLLMELRELLKNDAGGALKTVLPLNIPDFLLLGKPIEIPAMVGMKEDVGLEAARMLALEFWAKNQTALEAAGWSEDACVGMMCRAGVEIGAAKVEGEYIVFNKWTRVKAG